MRPDVAAWSAPPGWPQPFSGPDPVDEGRALVEVLAASSAAPLLLVDSSFLMGIHHRLLEALSSAAQEFGLTLERFDGDAEDAFPAPPPGDTRVAAVLTDGCGAVWDSPSTHHRLYQWAARHTLALLHTLRSDLWPRTAVLTQSATLHREGEARGPRAGRETRAALRYAAVAEDLSPQRRHEPEVVALPVMPAEHGAVRNWLGFACDNWPPTWQGDVWLLASAGPLWRRPPGTAEAGAQEGEAAADELIDDFLATASPGARHLAMRLAGGPVNLPVAEALQRGERLSSGSGRVDSSEIAEVLASPLLRRRPDAALSDAARSALEFPGDIRERLLERTGDLRAIRHSLQVLGEELSRAAPLYRWLAEVDEAAPASEEIAQQRELAEAVLPALSGLPGPYRRFERRLRAGLAGTQAVEPSSWKVETVAGEPSSQTPSEQPTGPGGPGDVYVGDLPRRNENFTGRERELAELHAALMESAGPYLVAGPTGYGKTQVAVEYAYRYSDLYRMVWWLPTDDPVEFRAALADLAGHLGVEKPTQHAPERLLHEVKSRLRDPARGRTLIVLDGAVHVEELDRQLVPRGGETRIIITSREQALLQSGHMRGRELHLPNPEDAVALLRKVCGEAVDAESAALIAERLGHLPLGLVQIGALLRDSLMESAEFLSQFDARLDEIVELAEPADDYQKRLAAAWDVQLQALNKSTDPAARAGLQLIQLCSFLAPAPIPARFLHRVRGLDIPKPLAAMVGDAVRLGKVTSFIRRHSLAEVNQGSNELHFHTLFQRVVQLGLPEDAKVRLRDAAWRLLSTSDPVDPNDAANRNDYLKLIPHIRQSRAWLSPDEATRDLVIHAVDFLDGNGDIPMALEMATAAFDAWLVEDEHRARWMQRLVAKLQMALGELNEALRSVEEAHHYFDRRPDTREEALRCRLTLGDSQQMLGRIEEAGRTYKQVWDDSLELLPENDRRTLSAAHGYGNTLQLLGRYGEALVIDKENAERSRLALGENHTRTITIQSSLAINELALGDYAAARLRIQDCVDRLDRQGEGNTPNALIIKSCQAVVLWRLGEVEEALRLAEASAVLFSERSGPTSPDSLWSRMVHMTALALAGHPGPALEEAESVIAAVEERYAEIKERKPLYPTALLNYALVLRANRMYARALEVDDRAMPLFTRIHGERGGATLVARVNRGSDLYFMGKIRDALDYDAQTAEACRAELDAGAPLALHAERNELIDRRSLGEDVAEQWSRLRETYAARLGPQHSLTVSMADYLRADCDLFTFDS